MSSKAPGPPIESAASHARPSTSQEHAAMQAVALRLDGAMRDQDIEAIMALMDASAICEFKPSGIRITARDTIAETFRRTLPKLSTSFAGRRQLREWSNQDGLLREWKYPVRLSSGEEVLTTQLEIIEFAGGLERILSYRIRMNSLFSKFFVAALGESFMSLGGIQRVPG